MPPIFNRRSWQNSGKVGKPFEAEGWHGVWPDRAIGSDGYFSPKGSEGQPKTFQCCREGVSIGNLRLSKSRASASIWYGLRRNQAILHYCVGFCCHVWQTRYLPGVSVCNCNLCIFDRAILSICRESCEHSPSFRPCVCFMLARPPGRGCKNCPPHHQAWARWSLDETRSDVSCHWNLLRSSDHLSPFRPLWNTLVVLPGSHMLPTVFHVGDQLIVSRTCVHPVYRCTSGCTDRGTHWHGLGKRLQNLSAVLWCNLPRSKRRCHIKVPSPGCSTNLPLARHVPGISEVCKGCSSSRARPASWVAELWAEASLSSQALRAEVSC